MPCHTALATDSLNNILLADSASATIVRLYDDRETYFTPFASSTAIACYRSFVFVLAQNAIFRLNRATGNYTVIAGVPLSAGYADGSGTSARFHDPTDLVCDVDGALYICDSKNHCIRKVFTNNDEEWFVETLAGINYPGFRNGTAHEAMFFCPTYLALDTNHRMLVVSDSHNKTIRSVSIADGKTGVIKVVHQAFGKLEDVRFWHPGPIACNYDSGEIFVIDSEQNALIRFTPYPDKPCFAFFEECSLKLESLCCTDNGELVGVSQGKVINFYLRIFGKEKKECDLKVKDSFSTNKEWVLCQRNQRLLRELVHLQNKMNHKNDIACVDVGTLQSILFDLKSSELNPTKHIILSRLLKNLTKLTKICQLLSSYSSHFLEEILHNSHIADQIEKIRSLRKQLRSGFFCDDKAILESQLQIVQLCFSAWNLSRAKTEVILSYQTRITTEELCFSSVYDSPEILEDTIVLIENHVRQCLKEIENISNSIIISSCQARNLFESIDVSPPSLTHDMKEEEVCSFSDKIHQDYTRKLETMEEVFNVLSFIQWQRLEELQTRYCHVADEEIPVASFLYEQVFSALIATTVETINLIDSRNVGAIVESEIMYLKRVYVTVSGAAHDIVEEWMNNYVARDDHITAVMDALDLMELDFIQITLSQEQ